jgi:hypothetical protein
MSIFEYYAHMLVWDCCHLSKQSVGNNKLWFFVALSELKSHGISILLPTYLGSEDKVGRYSVCQNELVTIVSPSPEFRAARYTQLKYY